MDVMLREQAAQDYESVAALVRKAACDFRRRHGGDLDELVAEANLAFMAGWLKYRPERGRLTTWTTWVVTHALLDGLRNRTKSPRTGPLPDDGPPAPPARDVLAELAEASEDAQTAAGAVLSPPLDVKINARLYGGGEDSPPSLRMAVREYLADIGWSAARVRDTFTELGDMFR